MTSSSAESPMVQNDRLEPFDYDFLTIGEDCDWIMVEGHAPLVEFALRVYEYARFEIDWADDILPACAKSRQTYARPPAPSDFADIDDAEERQSAYRSACDEGWMYWTDEPTDRPVTITGRLS